MKRVDNEGLMIFSNGGYLFVCLVMLVRCVLMRGLKKLKKVVAIRLVPAMLCSVEDKATPNKERVPILIEYIMQ